MINIRKFLLYVQFKRNELWFLDNISNDKIIIFPCFLKYGFFLTIVYRCFHSTEASFQSAVDLSQTSKFVHEEGLCHELAGMHYEELGEFQHALNSYRQAEKCYSTWGSQMKVNKTKDKILHVSRKLVSYNMLCSKWYWA